jgi:hypothetical protein
MKHHRRERNPQGDGGLLAVQNTGIAVPAFFRIFYLGGLLSAYRPEDVRRTDIGTNPAGITLLFVDDRRHSSSFLNNNDLDL